jgi:hypothetical protein
MGVNYRSFLSQRRIDTAVTKIGDFIVDFLREFEGIYKKALTRLSGRVDLWKKTEVENLVSGSIFTS